MFRPKMGLVRTGTVNKLEFREPVKFQTEFLFIHTPVAVLSSPYPLPNPNTARTASMPPAQTTIHTPFATSQLPRKIAQSRRVIA